MKQLCPYANMDEEMGFTCRKYPQGRRWCGPSSSSIYRDFVVKPVRFRELAPFLVAFGAVTLSLATPVTPSTRTCQLIALILLVTAGHFPVLHSNTDITPLLGRRCTDTRRRASTSHIPCYAHDGNHDPFTQCNPNWLRVTLDSIHAAFRLFATGHLANKLSPFYYSSPTVQTFA